VVHVGAMCQLKGRGMSCASRVDQKTNDNDMALQENDQDSDRKLSAGMRMALYTWLFDTSLQWLEGKSINM